MGTANFNVCMNCYHSFLYKYYRFIDRMRLDLNSESVRHSYKKLKIRGPFYLSAKKHAGPNKDSSESGTVRYPDDTQLYFRHNLWLP